MAFIQTATLPRLGLSYSSTAVCPRPTYVHATPAGFPGGLDIQAAKHVQFKATKKHERKRPRKHRPSDIHRKAPPYDVQPLLSDQLPPAWTRIAVEDIDSAPAPVFASATATSEAELPVPDLPESQSQSQSQS